MRLATVLVEAGSTSPVACADCADRFIHSDFLALHRGRRHWSRLSPEEREAFERAFEAEEEWLRQFRKKLKAGLGASVPMLVWGATTVLLIAGGGLAMASFLLLAPSLAFSALAYVLGLEKE